ncbi:N-methylhydantoinase B/oxoprolinase/acetone carboxylase, alpha subunit [Lampropedia hyalina DSM 16112]|jgi:N-methylhydantoinase B/oxoprolinase/acetone carboxylase alpha subunit|uniref:N-methylhydantoinase B/oxoprolinase/acetone carboxylase, alpha subunit n=1 Tax=Lampropedia hyalina DSM 16112 TaxID=1122156 RepID=A0A1M4XIP6_9BURK|nr:hydantoinase B/oxoprolinase family protein [Lampropedia hyalina]SHE93266.1 N-methylhydantoinase B/oxoprolinase/acetone carboxylase, alpha subunit [Lampropedia hyalina DSM 16112]
MKNDLPTQVQNRTPNAEEVTLIKRFMEDNTLFLGPDPEIMQNHDLMPRTELEETAIGKVADSHTIARIRDRLQSGCDEGYEMLEQMGAAPGAKWGDVITGVYSGAGDLAIASAGGVLLFSTVVHAPIKYINKYWIDEPTVGVNEGDGFIHNDSRYGNVHNTDQSMIMPIFHEGRLICWVASTVHEGENGAIEPGGMPSMAESRFDEGLKMSPFKVVENYQIKRDLLTFLQNSVREPKLQLEDMKVKLFSCLRIKQRIEEVLRTDGPDALVATLRLTMENVRAEVKRRISEWPDMSVRTYIIQDSTLRENCIAKINCTLTKTGDRLIFDFRGSAPEFTNRPTNTIVGSLKGMLSQLFMCYVWPDLPRGQAAFSPIEVITDPCSIVNSSYDAPNSQSLMSIFTGFTAGQHAVAKFLYSCPEKYTKVQAPAFNMINTFIWGGVNQHGETLGNLCADLNGMGGGARADRDGEPALAPIFATMADVGEQEVNEEEVPFLQLVSKKMTRDAIAPGKYRGGQGYTMIVATKDSEQWGFMTTAQGAKVPPIQGLFGGYACGTYPLAKVQGVDVYETLLNEPEKFRHSIEEIMNEQPFEGARYTTHHMGLGFEISRRGEMVMISQGAGGGYGDLLERDPAAVVRDIEDSLISHAVAERVYKVKIDPDTLAIDHETTKALRDAERRDRLQRGKPFAEFVKEWSTPRPPAHLPYFGAWGDDVETLYMGTPDKTRKASEFRPNYMPHPKDVRIAELEARLQAAGVPDREKQ